jgi:hypothetical protein
MGYPYVLGGIFGVLRRQTWRYFRDTLDKILIYAFELSG